MSDPRQQSGSTGPAPSELEAARLVLARMGVAPEDLVGSAADSCVVPTFAEYVPVVQQAVSAGTRRVYGSYWKRVLEFWGQRRLDEPTTSEIKQLAEQVRAQRVLRRNARGGRSAVEHCIAALRCVYRHAVADGIVSESQDPARRVAMPRRCADAVATPRDGLQVGRRSRLTFSGLVLVADSDDSTITSEMSGHPSGTRRYAHHQRAIT